MADAPAYRFASFVVSRRRRLLLNDGAPVALIPRYFDLLVLLLDRRPAVVTRREIFDLVWSDVVVSDGALTQAIRTLRRTLGDDSREPVFIRTASRHGYSFVFPAVEATDDEPQVGVVTPPAGDGSTAAAGNPGRGDIPVPTAEERREALLVRLRSLDVSREVDLEEARDVAEQLHQLGTAEALHGVVSWPGHAGMLAILRDARWDVPGAGPVPLGGDSEGLAAAWRLLQWRLREAHRLARRRWAQASGSAALAGVVAGLVGGMLLVSAPGSQTRLSAVPVLAMLGAVAGFAGGAGVAAGIAGGEAVARSRRPLAIVAGGAVGGLAIGLLLKVLVGWTLASVFGLRMPLGGGTAGLVLGLAVSAGYAIATRRRTGGMATAAGAARWRVAGVTGLASAAAAVLLSLAGYRLVGGIIHMVAAASAGSEVSLAPLGAWIGEPAFGPISRTLVAAAEGGLFGFGVAWGLTRRPGKT